MPPPKNRLLSEDYKMNNETVRLSKGACLLGDRDAGPTTFGPFSKSAKSTNGPFRELFVKKKIYIFFKCSRLLHVSLFSTRLPLPFLRDFQTSQTSGYFIMNWNKRLSGPLPSITSTIHRKEKDDALAVKVLAVHEHCICSQQGNTFYQETF